MQPTVIAILDHAEELVQLRGYNAFSYRDLAHHLGIKTSSIHYHFPTKADLAHAMVTRYRETFQSALHQITVKEKQTIRQLTAYADLFVATFRKGERLCLCGSLATDILTLSPPVRKEIQAFWKDNEAWLTGVLENGVVQQEIQPIEDIRSTARAIVSMLEGAMMSARVFGSEARLRQAKDWMFHLLCVQV